jgi:mono/diheme cytochrome c family protein
MIGRRRVLLLAAVLTPLLLAGLTVLLMLVAQQGGFAPFRVPMQGAMPSQSLDAVARGRYLATLGNCAGCHTVRGGVELAGGRAFKTAYGTVYSTNLTPDQAHGIGAWSVEEFRHAMRHGVSRNGVLSPVFPYASFRHLTDQDLGALLSYLHSVPASATPRRANALRFPANLPGALLAWRLLYFRPAPARVADDATQARGAYLVNGIGHCATCHAARGAFASAAGGDQLWGARNAGWFAPALHGPGLARFALGDVAAYLQGDAPGDIGGYGLMADVIARNLQHLGDDDAQAIEAYLRTLPAPPPKPPSAVRVQASAASLALGAKVYAQHCVDCHGDSGEGIAGKYPALRASPAITQDDPINLVQLIKFGALAPTTPADAEPYSMPPLAQILSAEEVAAVVNLLRSQANPHALPLGAHEISAMAGIE